MSTAITRLYNALKSHAAIRYNSEYSEFADEIPGKEWDKSTPDRIHRMACKSVINDLRSLQMSNASKAINEETLGVYDEIKDLYR